MAKKSSEASVDGERKEDGETKNVEPNIGCFHKTEAWTGHACAGQVDDYASRIRAPPSGLSHHHFPDVCLMYIRG